VQAEVKATGFEDTGFEDTGFEEASSARDPP